MASDMKGVTGKAADDVKKHAQRVTEAYDLLREGLVDGAGNAVDLGSDEAVTYAATMWVGSMAMVAEWGLIPGKIGAELLKDDLPPRP